MKYNLRDLEHLEDTADAELERLSLQNVRNRLSAKSRRQAEREADRAKSEARQ